MLQAFKDGRWTGSDKPKEDETFDEHDEDVWKAIVDEQAQGPDQLDNSVVLRMLRWLRVQGKGDVSSKGRGRDGREEEAASDAGSELTTIPRLPPKCRVSAYEYARGSY